MKKSVAVLGLGRYGSSVANELMLLGADVLGIDTDPEIIAHMGERLTCAANIDVRDESAMKGIGIGNFDVVLISMAEELESTIMGIILTKKFKVPMVIAKARDEVMGDILTKVGADSVIYPERESGKRLSRKILSSNFLEFFDISDSLCLVELAPKKEWIGKSLIDLNLRKHYKLNIIAKKTDGKYQGTVEPDEKISSDSTLVVTVSKNDLKRIME